MTKLVAKGVTSFTGQINLEQSSAGTLKSWPALFASYITTERSAWTYVAMVQPMSKESQQGGILSDMEATPGSITASAVEWGDEILHT